MACGFMVHRFVASVVSEDIVTGYLACRTATDFPKHTKIFECFHKNIRSTFISMR